MKVEGLDTITRDGIVYLDFYTVAETRDGTLTAHVTLSLRDLNGVIALAAQNKTRRAKRGPLRITRARLSPPVVIEGQLVQKALP